jgi:DHA1 family tetracycline resistance protein-like MFS transporter
MEPAVSPTGLPPVAPSRAALTFILVTVILNTLGLTLIAPVAPYLVARYLPDPPGLGVATLGAAVGWLSASYALCQFLAAPGLGALSDRFGRRPLLLLCLLGSALGYLFLGLGGALWVLFLGRIVDGLTGANTSILIAYIADLVPAESRGRYFGLIGAVGALSVVLGPAAGGWLARFGLAVPFYLAGGCALANVLFGLLAMPETLPPARRAATLDLAQLNPLHTLRAVLRRPGLRWLLAATALYTLATVIVPANAGVLTRDLLQWPAQAVGVLFSVFGVVTILAQGALLPWLLAAWGAVGAARVTRLGLLATLAAFGLIALLPLARAASPLYAAIILFGLGDGLSSPALLQLVTAATEERWQGQVQGASQSLQSLASVAGPLLAGELYDRAGPAWPYLAGALVLALALVMLARQPHPQHLS